MHEEIERLAFRKQRKESKKGRRKQWRDDLLIDRIPHNYRRKRAKDMGWRPV